MGLFANLFLGLLHLFVVVLDVAFVFAVARLLSLWKPWPLLLALARAGTPLVDGLIRKLRLDRLSLGRSGPSGRQRMCLLLFVICLARIMVAFVGGLVAQGHG